MLLWVKFMASSLVSCQPPKKHVSAALIGPRHWGYLACGACGTCTLSRLSSSWTLGPWRAQLGGTAPSIVPLVPSPTDPRQAEINAHQWESTCPSVWAEPMEIGTLGSEEGGQPRTPGILCESRKKAARTRTQIFFYLRPILMTECSFSLSIKKKKKIFQLIHSR